MRLISVRFAVLGLAALLLTAPAHAQTTFDPSRIPDQFALPPKPDDVPSMPALPAPVVPAAPANAPRFVLQQVQISGLSALDDNQVASLIDTYTGREVTLADVQELAGKLTQLYRERGFILSQVIIPPQRIENGVVSLTALEGHISKVTFSGAVDTWLKASAVALTAEQPLNINSLQRWLLLANDMPGLTVTGNLIPDPEVPSGSQLVIAVERENASVIAGFDNRGSKFIGPWQAYSGLQLNGLLDHGDTLAVRGYTSHPDGQLKYVQIQQSLPLGLDGLRLETTADVVRSEPGDSLKALGAEGKTDSLKLALTYPLIRSIVQNLVLGVTAEVSNSRTSILNQPTLTPSVNDRTRVLSALASYNRQYADSSVSSTQVTLSRGLDVMNASQGNTQNPSRAGAEPTFWRAIFEADYRMPLSFVKPGSTLLLAAIAQTSFGDSLLASEQLAAGGSAFGRGFDPAVVSGDEGLAAKAEISVPFRFDTHEYLKKTELYVFTDAAFVEDKNTASGIEPHRQLLSSGLGFRVSPTDNIAAYVEGAKQLPVSLLSNGDRPHGFRATVGMLARF